MKKTFQEIFNGNETFLMEGALGERLKHEYHLDISGEVAMASLVYQKNGCAALRNLWLQYLTIAKQYNLPFLATTPPLCYMTNCVHPRFLREALQKTFNTTDIVRKRFRGIQANTAALAYDKMDGSTIIQSTSSPVSLARDMPDLKQKFGFNIFGGCCGTDDSYMREIAKAII